MLVVLETQPAFGLWWCRGAATGDDPKE